MNSIRFFLLIIILAMVMLFNFVSALRGYQSSMQQADILFDKQLKDTAILIAKIYSTIPHDSNIAFQIWANNELITTSSNALKKALSPFESEFNFNNFDGYRWRTYSYYEPSKNIWVIAAERTDLRFILAENVILESILPVFISLPILGLLIWFIISKGLTPLRTLANELSNKQADDLGPLKIAKPKKELEQIVLSSNGLLKRLETSLIREKQFASDAAHELRTPISTLKIQLYNIAELLPKDTEELQQLNATVDRFAHIVEQILDLHRSSPDQFNASFTSINITALLQELIAESLPAFDNKQQIITFDGEKHLIQGDRFTLTTMFQNLLSNANKYTPAKGEIAVSVKENDQSIIIRVEDTGTGIPEAQREAVFKRFYRINGDRHNSGEIGCGLGLSIVKSIADLHHATISISDSTLRSTADKKTGTAITITMPSTGLSKPHKRIKI